MAEITCLITTALKAVEARADHFAAMQLCSDGSTHYECDIHMEGENVIVQAAGNTIKLEYLAFYQLLVNGVIDPMVNK